MMECIAIRERADEACKRLVKMLKKKERIIKQIKKIK